MAMLEDEEALIICNGYKDEEYIETALLASKLGRTVILVVEKPTELDADRRDRQARSGVRPRIGIRVKLAASGRAAGRRRAATARSSACRPRELVEAIDFLRAERPARLLRAAALPPRQPDLRHPRGQERAARGGPLLRRAVQAGRAAQVPRRRRRPGRRLRRLADQLRVVDELHDAGVRERHRVRAAWRSATPAGVPHPTIVTESGRAVVAHHSVLVVDVLGVSEFDVGKAPDKIARRRAPRGAATCSTTYREVSRKNLLEAYHDALEYKDEALQLFNLGQPVARPSGSSPRTSSGRSARRS